VLEIGCGEGYGSSLISEMALRVTAADNDKSVIEYAKSKYKKDNLEFIHFDGLTLPFTDSTFDTVVLFQVIEHIKEDKAFLKEIKRVLKTSGRLILTTPNREYRLKPGQKPWYKHHVREYSREELEDLLKSVFSEINNYSITAGQEIFDMQKKVAMLASNLKSLDFLGASRIVPFFIRRIIINSFVFLQNIFKRQVKQDYRLKYSLKDYSVTSDFVNCLDFLAICKK
jgi:ubiquinone/menaquinone biosynthesis C-methylase UbiE